MFLSSPLRSIPVASRLGAVTLMLYASVSKIDFPFRSIPPCMPTVGVSRFKSNLALEDKSGKIGKPSLRSELVSSPLCFLVGLLDLPSFQLNLGDLSFPLCSPTPISKSFDKPNSPEGFISSTSPEIPKSGWFISAFIDGADNSKLLSCSDSSESE